ncbi:type 2 lanthipeptide synthetase LanM family protein [Actinoplanes sp. NPDC049668]|uniref:type 2 lanthipeptide synthetase LanM family protein n=1 Tax=unclassified Actinoplanes TaxID=2626549 RepID=UPI0033A73AC5
MTESASDQLSSWSDVLGRLAGSTPDAAAVTAALAVPTRGIVTAARDRMLDRVRGVLPAAELAAAADGFTEELGARLVRLTGGVLATDFHARQRAGELTGDDGPGRFADFVHRLAGPDGLSTLLARYPVLGQLIAEAASSAADTGTELLKRYAGDRRALIDALLDGRDPGPLTGVHAGLGDPHQGGRSVALLTFGDGRRVIYKPRSLASYATLAALIDWLNGAVPGLDLRAAATLTRPAYGYAEFIAHRPLADLEAGARFYRRAGALLALLHAVRAVDLHCENLIADGEHPVLVDAEMLFHPELPPPGATDDPARRMLSASVHRTGLLPAVMVVPAGIVDCSGLGGYGAAAPDGPKWNLTGPGHDRLRPHPGGTAAGLNRPRLHGRELDPSDFEAALRGGLRDGYDAIMNDRAGFRKLLDTADGLGVRITFRPSRTYALLLDGATHPDLLRDDAGRVRAFGVLSNASAADELRAPLVEHEVADLRRGDIPFFTALAGGRDVWTATGACLPGLLPGTGLDDAAATLAAMGAADLHDQEWIVRATLASRHPVDGGHRAAAALPGPVPGHEAGPFRLLTAACGLADQILARGVTGGDRVNWLGLEIVDGVRWMVLPMGASLANGYLGVALFLAQLAELTGIARYRETARRAASAAGPLCESLAARPDLAVHVGVGGYQGFGGICYGLSRLSTLLDDPRMRAWAQAGVVAATAAAAAPGPPGVAGGTAGCLAAMRAVHAELGLSSAAALAATCADQLAAGPAGDGPGFADGRAGIAWALGDARGLAALDPPGDGDHGWCRGTAGLVAARGVPAGADPVDLARALERRSVSSDLSLCHGEAGITEALLVLADADPQRSVQRILRHRAGLVLDAIERYGPGCGTPGGVATPGLFNGLAGIGYGLLRLGFPARVPSVLLLEPSRPKEITTTRTPTASANEGDNSV